MDDGCDVGEGGGQGGDADEVCFFDGLGEGVGGVWFGGVVDDADSVSGVLENAGEVEESEGWGECAGGLCLVDEEGGDVGIE